MIKDFIAKFILNRTLKKALKRGIQALVAYLITLNIQQLGITVDSVQMEAGLLAVSYGVIEWLRNIIKQKFQLTWL